jgi:hypothetical protein
MSDLEFVARWPTIGLFVADTRNYGILTKLQHLNFPSTRQRIPSYVGLRSCLISYVYLTNSSRAVLRPRAALCGWARLEFAMKPVHIDLGSKVNY